MFGLRVIAQRMYKFSFSLLLFLFSTSLYPGIFSQKISLISGPMRATLLESSL
jgi:hypothetical protein